MTITATTTDMTTDTTSVLPPARVRTSVQVPLRFPDGYRTDADVMTFEQLVDGKEHLLLGLGDWRGAVVRASLGGEPPLVRPHSECLTGDVFGSERCDCGPQLREAVERIASTGGFLLYLRQEGRGIGLYAKLDAYALQDAGLDTYEANTALGHGEDERDYGAAAQMLQALGLTRLRLLSNNPDKAAQLERHDLVVAERVPTGLHLTARNARYLLAKRDHTAHTLSLPPQEDFMATVSSTATVVTDTPARYAKQLVSHLGRRLAFVEDPATRTWTAALGEATAGITVTDGEIRLSAEGPDADAVARVEHVLGSHLERFGTRQELAVAWQRAA